MYAFPTHFRMTKYDIKNYLEKIYKISVDRVAVANTKGMCITVQ